MPKLVLCRSANLVGVCLKYEPIVHVLYNASNWQFCLTLLNCQFKLHIRFMVVCINRKSVYYMEITCCLITSNFQQMQPILLVG